MKCSIPEISWHNREPVLSIDIHPNNEKFFRLATGGADCHVLIWQVNLQDNGGVKLEAISDLTRHQKAVNCVRWSPNGQYLATADDDANIIIWQLKTDNIPLLEGETNDKEVWIVFKVIRGHKEDIYDLCWAPSGQKLFSGSIDNTAILWDFAKGKSDIILTDHKGFVQGVAWDPKGLCLATISTDRICRIFDSNGKPVIARIYKGILPVPEHHYLYNKEIKYFHDDTFKSFFRRLDFSPDGSLLAVPSGKVELEDTDQILTGTYIFAVDFWAEPVTILPCGKQCSTVAKFCPILFENHEDGPVSTISLPYRMILAVGTEHDVILYDTQQSAPFAYFRDIHYTRLTDLTWSQDGQLLVASSTDGFCAIITFEPDELGVKYVKEESEVEESVLDVSGCMEIPENDDKAEIQTPKSKKPNFLEKWTIKTPKNSPKRLELSKNEPENITKEAENSNKIIDLTNETEEPIKKVEDMKVVKRINPIAVKSSNTTQKIAIPEASPSSNKNVQNNPLLNFLKRPSAEKKTTKKKMGPENVPPICAKIILDETEARDGWKGEEKSKFSDINSMKPEILTGPDYSSDFTLELTKLEQLEETHNDVQQNDNETVKDKEEIKNVPIIDNSKKVQNDNNKPNDSNRKINDVASKIKNDVKTINALKEEELKVDNNVKATKRRIPLITLSSPKHKKK